MTQHLIVTGNPVDGLTFHGPFDDPEAAASFGEETHAEWWLTTLTPPPDKTMLVDDGKHLSRSITIAYGGSRMVVSVDDDTMTDEQVTDDVLRNVEVFVGEVEPLRERHMIQAEQDTDNDGRPLYWRVGVGWVPFEDAQSFTSTEGTSLPPGGFWVSLDYPDYT